MSVVSGKMAEEVAAEYLKSRGYKVLDTNWRRPKCEIDIVAAKTKRMGLLKRDKIIHFVEVKYRRSAEQGSGLNYITDTKLRQMVFAAKMWIAENNWCGQYELSAVEVSGNDFVVTEFIEYIDT